MPGGTTCAVKSCKSNSKYPGVEGVSFHIFPKDFECRWMWTRFCNRNLDWCPKKHDVLCSKHFTEDDFEQTGQVPTGFLKRKRLKKNVVPTVESDDEAVDILDDDDDELSTSSLHDEENIQFDVYNDEPISIAQKQELSKVECKRISNTKVRALENDIEILRQMLKTEQEKNFHLMQSLQITSAKLKRFEENSILKDDIVVEIKKRLSSALTSNQIDLILDNKKKVQWTKEEIRGAFTLRHLGEKAYDFLRKQHYPLPNPRTLRRYAESGNLKSGILNDMLMFLKPMAELFTPKQRAVVLMFDEMRVKTTYEYSNKTDEIFGPYNYVQVVLVQGLFSNWKQPVYVGFDQVMDKDLLFEIIVSLHNVSLDVVAIVGDCAPSNSLSHLGIGIDQVYFLHPNTDEKVFCFYDAPYLLKLIRKWFINSGFLLEDNTVVNKGVIEHFISKALTSETNSSHHLREEHIQGNNHNILLAMQLFSEATVEEIKKYYNLAECNALVDFIQLVNEWFNIFNSKNIKTSHILKKPYEGNPIQFEKLGQVYKVFKSLRCTGKATMQGFQKAVVICCEALHQFYEEMHRRFDIKFIVTTKLNREPLETLFTQVKNRGGVDGYLTPLNFMHHLRAVILEKAPDNEGLPEYIPAIQDEFEEYAAASILTCSDIEPLVEPMETESDAELDALLEEHSTRSSSSPPRHIERDGFNCLSRWLVRKFKGKYPKLGMIRSPEGEDHNYTRPSWTLKTCDDRLEEPSEMFLQSLKMLEWWFKKLNKTSFVYNKNVMKKLLRELKDRVDIPEEVTKAFIQHRIRIRIKKLNHSIKTKKDRNISKSILFNLLKSPIK